MQPTREENEFCRAAAGTAGRRNIDNLLIAAGWVIQDRKALDRHAGVGVAVRELPTAAGPCDYSLFIDGKAAGVIEAKRSGTTLSGVAEQSARYMDNLPAYVASWADPLIYSYESTGDETFFLDRRDPKPRSRRLFAFHRPETLLEWLQQPDTLRARLAAMPPLDVSGLRDCQIEAITGLERSLAQDKPRALIQLATGAGKTFTACSFPIASSSTRAPAASCFGGPQQSGRPNPQGIPELSPGGHGQTLHRHLHRAAFARLAHRSRRQGVITTIQRLYSILRGKEWTRPTKKNPPLKMGIRHPELPPLTYNPIFPSKPLIS